MQLNFSLYSTKNVSVRKLLAIPFCDCRIQLQCHKVFHVLDFLISQLHTCLVFLGFLKLKFVKYFNFLWLSAVQNSFSASVCLTICHKKYWPYFLEINTNERNTNQELKLLWLLSQTGISLDSTLSYVAISFDLALSGTLSPSKLSLTRSALT